MDKPLRRPRLATVIRPTLLSLILLAGHATAGEPEAPPAPATEQAAPVIRDGQVTIAGKKIDYQVSTAKLVLKKDDGSPRASIFHVSYLRKDIADIAQRPVLFAFNGGPGSSAVWLHLGILGPKRVELPGDGTIAPMPPARIIENEFSLLDVADLVFVDPVSTGYSRIEKDGKAEEFHGVEGDIDSLADFIRRWVTDHGRWSSPKFLLGESYGGIRVAGLSAKLQTQHGMPLNGIVLLSSLLDFRTLSPSHGNDLAYQVFLPTYTAVAHHHGKLQGNRDDLVRQAREFAAGDYSLALQAGASLDPAKLKAVAEKLASLTSLPAALFVESKLRIDPSRFRGELLRAEGKVLGRFDARVAWPSTDPAYPYADYDPSFSLALGAYSTAMLAYLGQDLGWKEDSPYEILTTKVQPWKMGDGNGFVNLSGRLATAMRDNPHLRVLVMGGKADLATPPDGIEHSLKHLLELPDSARKNIVRAHYDSGHMFYLNPPDLAQSRNDLAEFIRASH